MRQAALLTQHKTGCVRRIPLLGPDEDLTANLAGGILMRVHVYVRLAVGHEVDDIANVHNLVLKTLMPLVADNPPVCAS
jgi:hypothetical protein